MSPLGPAVWPAAASGAGRRLKLAGYTRISASGLDRDLDRQAAAIRRAACSRRWEVCRIVPEKAVGADLDRRALAAVLSHVRGECCDGLVVARLDRLICSLAQFRRLFCEAAQSGWVLIALDVGIDLSTSAGRARAAELGRSREYERGLTGMRTAEALAARKAAGIRVGRPRSCPDAVLERVVQLRARGALLTEIADDLNRDRVPTPGGGRRWYASHVCRLLRTQDALCLIQDA
jgi:DNA invertase Pin-like site-specific DNA recombinase